MNGSSDFHKKFLDVVKILSAISHDDTLTLVTAEENRTPCEQLVNNTHNTVLKLFAPRLEIPFLQRQRPAFRFPAYLGGEANI